LHALTACILYFFTCELLSIRRIGKWAHLSALFTAILFALHPLHVSSVVYIVQRRGILSTLFYLIALWSFLKTREKADPRRFASILITLVSGSLSAKSKTMGLTLPIALWALHLIVSLQHDVKIRKPLVIGSVIIALGSITAAVLLLRGTITASV